MIARFLTWWRRPSLRHRILNALSETEWSTGTDVSHRAKLHPFRYGAISIELINLESEGLVESRPGPNRRMYRKTHL